MDIDPLRLINTLLQGYIQDKQHRLDLEHHAYEYDHYTLITDKIENLQAMMEAAKEYEV